MDEKVKDLKKEIQKKTRIAYRAYIESIITPMYSNEDESPNKEYLGIKRFWRFIKSQRKDYSRVSTLRENGKTTDDPKERADILNRNFESISIQEEHIPSDLLTNTFPYPDMKDIQITQPGVLKMLERQKPHKAMGPD